MFLIDLPDFRRIILVPAPARVGSSSRYAPGDVDRSPISGVMVQENAKG